MNTRSDPNYFKLHTRICFLTTTKIGLCENMYRYSYFMHLSSIQIHLLQPHEMHGHHVFSSLKLLLNHSKKSCTSPPVFQNLSILHTSESKPVITKIFQYKLLNSFSPLCFSLKDGPRQRGKVIHSGLGVPDLTCKSPFSANNTKFQILLWWSLRGHLSVERWSRNTCQKRRLFCPFLLSRITGTKFVIERQEKLRRNLSREQEEQDRNYYLTQMEGHEFGH